MDTLRQQRLAFAGLLAVAAIWGSSFPMTKVIFRQLPVLDYLAVRFLLAALATALIFARQLRRLSARGWATGAVLGVVYGGAQILQSVGLTTISPAVSGFITGLYVVVTPLLAWLLLRNRGSGRAWLGAVVSLVGLGLLSLQGFAMGYGEVLTTLSAIAFALHIVLLGHWSSQDEAIALSVVQLFACGLVCLAAAAPDGIELPKNGTGWLMLLYLALVCGAVAMLVQTWAQAHLAANRAAIVMSMEPVFATLWSVLFLIEPLTWRLLAGGALMLAGMLIVELRPRRRGEAPAPEELPHVAAP